MNLELDRKLTEKYPKVFRSRQRAAVAANDKWGVDCGDGWFRILDALCATLSATYQGSELTRDDGEPSGVFEYEAPQVVFTAVAEKFGTLRVYYGIEFSVAFEEQAKHWPRTAELIRRHARGYVSGVMDFAETLSGITCEETGLAGVAHTTTANGDGWIRTLNADFAKTDPRCVSRGFVPADAPKSEQVGLKS